MKTCEVLDLTKSGKVVYSLNLAVLEVQFGKSKSFKWKRDWGEHSLHCFKKWFHSAFIAFHWSFNIHCTL